jgi:proline iminopeptidase
LVIAGRHDLFCSPQQSDRIATRISEAQMVTFEHGGHYMWLDEPDAFFDQVAGPWLAGQTSAQ